jgi:hypothetical protein
MKPKTRQVISGLIGLAIIGLLLLGMLWLIVALWRRFVGLNPNLAVGLLTAFTTVIVATVTLAFGRYFERKKEIEAHFRDKKIAIYDEFLKQFFKLYYESSDTMTVDFLREWQRQAFLWGGANVLNSFLTWRVHLGLGKPDAKTMFLMEDFFRALRKDIGLSNRGLNRGSFIRMILKHPDLFFAMASANPNVTLAELSEKEKELGLES